MFQKSKIELLQRYKNSLDMIYVAFGSNCRMPPQVSKTDLVEIPEKYWRRFPSMYKKKEMLALVYRLL